MLLARQMIPITFIRSRFTFQMMIHGVVRLTRENKGLTFPNNSASVQLTCWTIEQKKNVGNKDLWFSNVFFVFFSPACISNPDGIKSLKIPVVPGVFGSPTVGPISAARLSNLSWNVSNARPRSSIPHFKSLKNRCPPFSVSEPHKNCRLTYFEALKLWGVRSGGDDWLTNWPTASSWPWVWTTVFQFDTHTKVHCIREHDTGQTFHNFRASKFLRSPSFIYFRKEDPLISRLRNW